MVIATASAAASYILAAAGKETAGDVTVTVFGACCAYLVSYAAASTTEKVSRQDIGSCSSAGSGRKGTQAGCKAKNEIGVR